MILKLQMTGHDLAIDNLQLAKHLMLIYCQVQLDWFGRTVIDEMQKQPPLGHPPGGPHPPDGELPVFGEHAYIDRTGYLTRSMGYTVELWQGHRATVSVFALAPYADAVEYGTTHSRPYPFFFPVFYKYLPILHARLQAAAERAFNDAANRDRTVGAA